MARKETRELKLKITAGGISKVKRGITRLTGGTDDLKKSLALMGKGAGIAFAAVAVGAAAAGAAIGGIGFSLVRTGAQMERFRVQLNTIVKDEQKAAKILKEIGTFAATTPFELPELVEARTRLIQFGQTSEETLRIVGDAAAALDQPVLMAAEAIADAVAGEFERLKEFGISGAKISAELGHKASRETAQDLQDNVDAVLRIMVREFGGGMEALSKTWTGVMSNFADFFFRVRAQVAEGGFFDTLKGEARDLLVALNALSGKGGIGAITLGFNDAFKLIFETFFVPMKGGISLLEGDMRDLGLAVAEVGTEIALILDGIGITGGVVTEFIGGIKEVFASGEAPDQNPAERIYGKIDDHKARRAIILETRQIIQDARRFIASGETKPIHEVLGLDFIADQQHIAAVRERIDSMGVAVQKAIDDQEPLVIEVAIEDSAFGANTGGLDQMADQFTVRRDLHTMMIEDEMVRELELVNVIDDAFRSRQDLATRAYSNIFNTQSQFARKSAGLEQILKVSAISAISEGTQAYLEGIKQKALIDAAYYTARALGAIGSGNFAAAAAFGGAATQAAGIGSLAAIGQGVIQGQADRFINAPSPIETFDSGQFVTSGGTAQRGSVVSRTEQAPIINNITITYHVAGDYLAGEDGPTDLDQIQDAFDEGLVAA